MFSLHVFLTSSNGGSGPFNIIGTDGSGNTLLLKSNVAASVLLSTGVDVFNIPDIYTTINVVSNNVLCTGSQHLDY